MKKFLLLLVYSFMAYPAAAQTTLSTVLPLLQQTQRTPAQTQQVLALFRTARDPDTVFAAGASLVKTPPAHSAEPVLLNQIIQGTDPLKTAFSAIILTAMGSVYEELTPLLQDTLQSQDPVLRAYGAGAYALANPADTTHANDVVRLFIFDEELAQRAMNLLARTGKEQTSFLKQAAAHKDPQVRAAAAAWLGTLHTPAAARLLLKRAKTETDATVQTQLATALAKTPDLSLEGAGKGLAVAYQKPQAATYALALGFMTGNSIDTIKNALTSKNQHIRINALRSAAYMAGVFATPEAFTYSTERAFDIRLLKGLIPLITALAQQGTAAEQPYARQALTQIEKLM